MTIIVTNQPELNDVRIYRPKLSNSIVFDCKSIDDERHRAVIPTTFFFFFFLEGNSRVNGISLLQADLLAQTLAEECKFTADAADQVKLKFLSKEFDRLDLVDIKKSTMILADLGVPPAQHTMAVNAIHSKFNASTTTTTLETKRQQSVQVYNSSTRHW